MNTEVRLSPSSSRLIALTLLTTPLALYRLPPTGVVPAWTTHAREFLTISRTPTELSIVTDEAALPEELDAERGYRAFRVDGPLQLDLIGIFAVIAGPLADAAVPIFPIATYDTDYVLVPGSAVTTAITALEAAGHRVSIDDARSVARET